MLLFLLDLYKILSLLSKQYFSHLVETVALAQPYVNGIQEKWDPGPMTLRWDPGLGP